MSAGDVAQIASAVFVAAAATASWISVAQSRKTINAAALPELHSQALAVGLMSRGNEGTLAFVIHNAGGGLAKGVGFIFATESQFVVQMAGTGFLLPNSTVHVRSEMQPREGWSDRSRGVVFCRSREEKAYGWTLNGRRKKLASGHDWAMTATEIWNRFYPDRPLDKLEQVPAIVQQGDLFS